MTCSKTNHDRQSHGHPCVVCQLENVKAENAKFHEACGALTIALQSAVFHAQKSILPPIGEVNHWRVSLGWHPVSDEEALA